MKIKDKVVLIAFLTMMACSVVKAQDIIPSPLNLDVKNGFNKFELRASLASVSNIALMKKISSDGSTDNYMVLTPSKYTVFGIVPDNIFLTFYKGKLMKTAVSIPRPSSSDEQLLTIDRIMGSYYNIYGEWTKMEATGNLQMQSAIAGEKVILFFHLFKVGHDFIGLTFMDIALQTLSDSDAY